MQVGSTPSPSGDIIVFSHNSQLCRMQIRHYGRARPVFLKGGGGIADKDVTSIKWSADGAMVVMTSQRAVHVASIDQSGEIARVKNGSGGLGSITTADFIAHPYLMVMWEFGKAKLFDLSSGKSVDLPDLKMVGDGPRWQCRPGHTSPALCALLHRPAAEDHLALHFVSLHCLPALIKLPTIDVQALKWSPDGRWLAVRDVPTVTSNVHIYTPDGHLFRSPSGDSHEGLGVKDMLWSSDSRLLALAHYDGRVALLNTDTFSPRAVVEHHTTIDQTSLPLRHQASVWQENVSASNDRSYLTLPQPVSPPLSRLKAAGPDPVEHGVAELSFNCDGSFLATRDCRMLNTFWIWTMAKLSLHTVVTQHSNIRRLIWHPTRAETLMIDCAEGIAHYFDINSSHPPIAYHTGTALGAKLSWIQTTSAEKPIIMVTEKTRFELLYPEGRDEATASSPPSPVEPTPPGDASWDEGASEDSLFAVLSGRRPLPPKTEASYTERVDLDLEAEEDVDEGAMEDTFRERRKCLASECDPLDDSDIF